MEKNINISFNDTLDFDPSRNVIEQMTLAMTRIRGNIEQEVSKALAGVGVTSTQHQELTDSLMKNVEQQISKALADMRNREIQNTPCANVIMPSGKSVNLSCIAPDQDRGLTITAEEYSTIEKEMQDSIVDHVRCGAGGGCFSSYEVVKIQKLYNTSLFEQYLRVKAEVVEQHGSANEHMLYHGSPRVPDIIREGFNTQFANPNGLFGSGIYFAPNSSKSNQYVFGYMGGNGCPDHGDKNCYICERQLLLCRVILGKEYSVTKSTRVKSLPEGYHSLKGVEGKGLRYPEYVVYNGRQAYPEYIITYKIVK